MCDYWGVENRLHECLDVTVSEDSTRNRMDSGPQNLVVLRHMALNVMRKEEAKMSQRGKLKKSRMEQQLSRRTPRPFLKCNRPGVSFLNRNQYGRDLDGD